MIPIKMNLVAFPLTKIKLFSYNELTYPFFIMARGKTVSRGKAAATITVSTQTIKELIAQIAGLSQEVAALRQVVTGINGGVSPKSVKGAKKPRRVSAVNFYVKAVIDTHKAALGESKKKKENSLTGLPLYTAAKKLASLAFENLTAEEQARYQRIADKQNKKNGLGAVKTPSTKTKKAVPKKKTPAKKEESEESESEDESEEESGTESKSESGSGSESGTESGSSEGEEETPSDNDSDEELLNGLSDSEEDEPPKQKGKGKAGQKGKKAPPQKGKKAPPQKGKKRKAD